MKRYSVFECADWNIDEANIFSPSDLMWRTRTVGVGQATITPLDLESGLFCFQVSGRTRRQSERPQRGKHKGEWRRFGRRPKQTVCSTNVNGSFCWLGKRESVTRWRRRGESAERAVDTLIHRAIHSVIHRPAVFLMNPPKTNLMSYVSIFL